MENHKNILKGFTKQEIINYLDVKDRLTDAKNIMGITNNKIKYIDIMLYTLPIILVLIAILIIYLVYKNNYKDNKKDII
jgi:cytochrome c-type biogenesis protein CcmH/NrfF